VATSNDLLVTARKGEDIELFIHTAVREDDISLYGFLKKDELKLFEKLLTVSGIGPKMAMEILGAPLNMVHTAIVSEDIATLTSIKGLGKKTAERLVLELKNKLPAPPSTTGGASSSAKEEAISALEGLGYERSHIIKVISAIPAQIKETEEVVKYFLKSAS
jgi:Holliday junction DNA helicase RuvA